MKKVIGAGLALATMALASGAVEAQTLRVRLNADIRSTDPGVNRDANTDAVVLHMVEGLVAFREDTSVGPLLAETYEASDDGKTYTFTLRDGVTFHNGAKLTADDVVWTWKRFLEPSTQWRCLSEFDGRGFVKILSVEAKDAKTVVFSLDQPSALFLATMARPDCGGSGIVHKDSLGPDGKWKEPVGTGPFKLADWRRGQHVELVRFDGYSSRPGPRDGFTGGKKAEVEKLRWVIVPDSSAAKAALLGNSLDIVDDVAAADLPDLKSRSEATVVIAPNMNLVAVLMQTKDPLLQDVRIRRALALSLDTPQLVAAATQETGQPNNSAVPVKSPFYGPVQKEGFRRNLAEAKKLLQEAGYKGQTIKLIANKRYAPTFDAAVMIQAMAQEAGIKIDVEVLDWATQLDRYTKGDYQAMSFPYSARLDPSLNFEMFTGPKATQPRKVWDNPDVQAMLRESMQTIDKTRRQALFDDLHKRLIAEVPLVILYNGADITALRKNVAGYEGWPASAPRYWNVSLR
jgi:peptide/nickel transport system substrate-binding protein